MAAGILLSGCASDQQAALAAARDLVRPARALEGSPLDPALRYLRVTTNGKPALLVLGYVDQDAHGRPVEVWYSAHHEVVRMQYGRLAGTAGVPVEWRAVAWPPDLPRWSAITAPHRYERLRDEMPGYRVGLRDRVTVRPIDVVPRSELQGVPPDTLRWFEESTEGGQPAPARYGVRITPEGEVPVYGEQCLAPRFCITWQVWPPMTAAQVS